MTKIILVSVCVLVSSGCYKATFMRNVTPVGTMHERWTSHFLFGAVRTSVNETRDFCPEGEVRSVQTGANFGTGLVAFFTLGIYVPHKIYIRCGTGPSLGEPSSTTIWRP